MANKRHIMRIELTGPAKRMLETMSDRHGMTQLSIMSRLVEFFASRDLNTQIGMVGRFPEEMKGEIARRIVKSLDGKGQG